MSINRKVGSAIVSLAVLMATGTASANHKSPGRHSPTHQHHPGGGFQLLHPYFSAGFGFGGDAIGRFEDDEGIVEKVRAGGGGYLEGGVVLGISPWTSLRFTGGYQASSVSRINGDSTFERLQFSATALHSYGFHELGAGLTLHTGVQYDCNIEPICADEVDFESALGFTLEYAVRPVVHLGREGTGRRGLRLGLRFTGIEYEPELAGAESLDGSSLAGFVGVVF